MFTLIERWLKTAALEAQEYVHLTTGTFVGAVSRPFYTHDVVEQFDLIGVGSLTVVLLSGLFTGMALASQPKNANLNIFEKLFGLLLSV